MIYATSIFVKERLEAYQMSPIGACPRMQLLLPRRDAPLLLGTLGSQGQITGVILVYNGAHDTHTHIQPGGHRWRGGSGSWSEGEAFNRSAGTGVCRQGWWPCPHCCCSPPNLPPLHPPPTTHNPHTITPSPSPHPLITPSSLPSSHHPTPTLHPSTSQLPAPANHVRT